MTEFVLVPGAWLGSWAWDGVLPDLRAADHGVHPVTLSGLADKQGVAADPRVHVQDIVDEIDEGSPGRRPGRSQLLRHPDRGGAQRIGDRLSHVVFVNAFSTTPSPATTCWSARFSR